MASVAGTLKIVDVQQPVGVLLVQVPDDGVVVVQTSDDADNFLDDDRQLDDVDLVPHRNDDDGTDHSDSVEEEEHDDVVVADDGDAAQYHSAEPCTSCVARNGASWHHSDQKVHQSPSR